MPKYQATRDEVYLAIDGERDYQSKWDLEESQGQHSVAEFIVYMQAYLNKAIEAVSFSADPAASQAALHVIRKVTALGVACMEQNGAPVR